MRRGDLIGAETAYREAGQLNDLKAPRCWIWHSYAREIDPLVGTLGMNIRSTGGASMGLFRDTPSEKELRELTGSVAKFYVQAQTGAIPAGLYHEFVAEMGPRIKGLYFQVERERGTKAANKVSINWVLTWSESGPAIRRYRFRGQPRKYREY